MKKFSILFLFVFCLTALFGATLSSSSNAAEAVDGVVTISSAQELVDYSRAYDTSNQNDTIVLGKSIDMSTVSPITSPIGTASAPFMGTFNGNGCTISNLKIDISSSGNASANQFAGLFGVAEGATFQNVGFDQTVSLVSGSALSTHAGTLVAKANGCTFKNIQLVAKIDARLNFDSTISFGGLVGSADNSSFSYIISRVSDFGNWNFSNNNENFYFMGAVVGKQSNSSVLFGVVESKFDVNVQETFLGQVYVGGVSGVVTSAGSRIINVAVENTFAIVNNSQMLWCGEVAGGILAPMPVCDNGVYNLSYIYYDSANIRPFGKNAVGYDVAGAHINPSEFKLSSLEEENGEYPYFTSSKHLWHPTFGGWRFDTIWFVNKSNSKISLQCFNETFSIRVTNSNPDILVGELKDASVKYGSKATIEFKFQNNMSKFYSASALYKGTSEVAKIYAKQTSEGMLYTLSDNEKYDIVAINDGFEIVIKDVNMATEGAYSVTTTAQTFVGTIGSKLFGEDGMENTEVESAGYVFYADGSNRQTRSITLNKLIYGQHYRIDTRPEAGKPYAFMGWYKVASDGTEEKIGNNTLFDFTFGQTANFDDSFDVYAKYSINACKITCKLEDGIVKIVVGEENEVTENEQVVAVPKGQEIGLKICVENGFTFDVEAFVAEIERNKVQDPNTHLCVFNNVKEESGFVTYNFSLFLNALRAENYDAFTLIARTNQEKNTSNSWIWWVVGGCGGVVVLAGIIILIVVLVKRRGGGMGGSSGGGSMKKSYKNMYY